MYKSIVVAVDDSVGIVTLNKPDRHNALDALVVDELTHALLALDADPGVRAVVLSATGKSFCAGTDINWLRKATTNNAQDNQRDANAIARLLRSLSTLAKPTLARVHGPAFGTGVGLIAACDIAIATYDAQFALTETKLGLLPSVISPYLVRAVGERHARRYLLTAERFSAAEAYRLGLVHEVVPGDDELDEAIGELVDRLLRNAPNAQAQCKAILRLVADRPIDETLVVDTVQRAADARSSAEGQEGLAAFIEKRRPNWSR